LTRWEREALRQWHAVAVGVRRIKRQLRVLRQSARLLGAGGAALRRHPNGSCAHRFFRRLRFGAEPHVDAIAAGIDADRRVRRFEQRRDHLVELAFADAGSLQRARDEIRQSWRATCAENADHPRAKELFDRHKLPAFHDPFAGGSSLPLEAQGLAEEVQTPKTRCYGPTALMTCDEYACGGRRGTNEK